MIIGTDQNFYFLKIGTHVHIYIYISSSLLPTTSNPTRITHNSATIIDNLFVKYNHNLDLHSGIIISDMSDHLSIFCFLSYKKKQKRKAEKALTFESRPITADGISAVINKLQHIDWNCLEHSTTDDAYNIFIQQLNNIMDVCIPNKKVVIPSRFVIRNPWMTKGLVTSSRTSTKLYHKCMKKPRTDPLYIKYIKFRNCYNTLKRMANIYYYAEVFDKYIYEIRDTWKTIRNLIGTTNDKTTITQMFKVGNNTISDPGEIGDNLCNFFANVCPTYANKIIKPIKPYNHYLKLHRTRNNKTFFLTPTDLDETLNVIKSLKAKSSCSNDKITAIILKHIGLNIAEPISILINTSITNGTVPELMKTAKVIPIYKSKARDDFSNYRQISILPTVSKILEKIVHKLCMILCTNVTFATPMNMDLDTNIAHCMP